MISKAVSSGCMQVVKEERVILTSLADACLESHVQAIFTDGRNPALTCMEGLVDRTGSAEMGWKGPTATSMPFGSAGRRP